MEKKSRIGLLEQFEIACLKPGKYNKLIKNQPARRWLYVFLVVFLLTIIESGIPFGAWEASVGGLENFMTNGIPKFTLSADGMDIKTPLSIDLQGVIRITADSSKKSYSAADFDDEYEMEFLISKTNVMVKSLTALQEYKMSSLGNVVITNQTLLSWLPIIRITLVFYFILLLVTNAVTYLLWCLIYGTIGRAIVRTKEGKTVTFKEAFSCSVYARTLCAIVISVNYCLGGMVDSTILLIITVFVIMAYLRAAEKSLLTDNEIKR